MYNPAVPASLLLTPTVPEPAVGYQQKLSHSIAKTNLIGTGPERYYLPIEQKASPPWERQSHPSSQKHQQQVQHGIEVGAAYAPRPIPGSILDLDRVLDKCDFSTNKYVRDCLEYLRVGGHLDNGRRYRRSNLTEFQHIFTEDPATAPKPRYLDPPHLARLMLGPASDDKVSLQALSAERKEQSLSREPLVLPTPLQPSENLYNPSKPCDPKHPRIFHMFWAGPFTDKPYMAVMSFLFTQNLGLHLTDEEWNQRTTVCRPQFWVWINPGPAAALPNPSARKEMYEALAVNPWSAPFLHAKFREVVKFKMWNTTEQLDGIPELREHWRTMPIFNSGGNTYGAPQGQATPPEEPIPFKERDIDSSGNTTEMAEGEEKTLMDSEGVLIIEKKKKTEEAAATPAPIVKKNKGGLFEKVGSTSENDYDRLSVILSDMARFILTYRYGGIYLDADTMFLRDWEELWNWHGQFAYRWSFHQKYNTAVLKLHKGSALASFLFKTALENGLDFHPMTVSRYLKDADLERLLFRIPDALFDPAWINFEKYQRDRPPFPYFPEQDLMGSSEVHSPTTSITSDLGPRFIKGERTLREAAVVAKFMETHPDTTEVDIRNVVDGKDILEDDVDEDEQDLSWSTVLKRTFEAYLRSERPNMYGEWLRW
ncbi:hypothetical protein QFC24_001205 [Naganishia onofrii]|uniref:Uncharacterized protein n=1 Tax=Naganishia onofrii TaxID=1851511 RepID=A0ACC2XUC2_9TREE|nr:hypothetical protein QFC24_001205 [Naganishia onofrii]